MCAKWWVIGQRSVLIIISLLQGPASNAKLQAIGQPSIPGTRGYSCLANGNSGLKLPAPVVLPQEVTSTGLDPRVCMDVACKTITFLLKIGATYSVFNSFSGPLFSQSYSVLSIARKSITRNLPSIK